MKLINGVIMSPPAVWSVEQCGDDGLPGNIAAPCRLPGTLVQVTLPPGHHRPQQRPLVIVL